MPNFKIAKTYGPARNVMRHVWPHAAHVISITVGPSTTIRDRRIRDVTLRLPHAGHRPRPIARLTAGVNPKRFSRISSAVA